MPVSKEMSTPSPVSKMIGLTLMVLLPILGFLLGFYSQPLSLSTPSTRPGPITPTAQPVPFSGSLEIFIAGAEAVLTDRQGRRTGYDRATMTHITEIPESMYFDSKIIPHGGSSNDRNVRNLLLSNTIGGFYDLEIIPPPTTLLALPFSISVTGIGPDYINQSASASGILNQGTTQQFHIDFDPGAYLQIRSLTQ